ncbi:MAG TPA: cobalt ECF transporter T component CbiQ [Bacteroidetes bacterium]|nr:cobalt ECF transporter T component CbiQ [Bacteroidota bacterium]
MRHDFIDRYSRLSSPIHRLPAGLKLLIALVTAGATVSIPISDTPCILAAAVFVIIVAIASEIPIPFLLKRLLMLEPFVLGVALLSLFQSQGVIVFTTVLLKSTVCLFTMILLSNTTPFADLLRVLQQAHVPRVFLTILALMYRYLFLLIDETERMHRARMSRTYTATRLLQWRSLAPIVGQLFVRSSERAERIYAAMCARGWK